MIILCGADFHGNQQKYKRFFEGAKKEKPDVIVMAGDLGRIDESFYEIECPAFAVHGNMDGLLFLSKIKIVDEKLFEFNGYRFLGLGWNFKDIVEENGKKLRIEDADFDIIISHAPPYKTKDRSFLGMHIGSKKLRSIIEKKKPDFVLCGHVHEDYGYVMMGKTVVVNCSVGKKGSYTIIDTENKKIKMIGY